MEEFKKFLPAGTLALLLGTFQQWSSKVGVDSLFLQILVETALLTGIIFSCFFFLVKGKFIKWIGMAIFLFPIWYISIPVLISQWKIKSVPGSNTISELKVSGKSVIHHSAKTTKIGKLKQKRTETQQTDLIIIEGSRDIHINNAHINMDNIKFIRSKNNQDVFITSATIKGKNNAVLDDRSSKNLHLDGIAVKDR